jgi:hypothetical protein
MKNNDTAALVVEPTVEPTVSQDFAQAKTYLHMAKMSMAQSAAFMILAGAELERLHHAHAVKPGQPKKNSPNVGGILWGDLVKRELGIGEETARRYRLMFKAAKKRVPMLNAEELLSTPIGELPELRQQNLLAAVRKVTDGATAQQLMFDWNLAKRPQGSGAKGGDTGGTGKVTPELLIEMKQAQAQHLINLLIEALDDKYWIACDTAKRTELHGLLEDVRSSVKETL